jgi:titin
LLSGADGHPVEPDGAGGVARYTTEAGGTVELDSADGSFTYRPPAGYVGPDTFHYQVTDGAQLAREPARVAILVHDQAPVGCGDQYRLHHAAGPLDGNVLDSDHDPDGDMLSLEVGGTAGAWLAGGTVATHAGGAVSVQADGTFRYQPPAGFLGIDRFVYRPTDGVLPGDAVTVTIELWNNVARPVPDVYAAHHDDMPLAGNVLANDGGAGGANGAIDWDGDAVVGQLVAGPEHGTVRLEPDGTFSYVREAGFVGTDSFITPMLHTSGDVQGQQGTD